MRDTTHGVSHEEVSYKNLNQDVWKRINNDPGRSRVIIRTTMTNTRSQLRHSTSIDIGGRPKPIVSSDYIVCLTE